MPNLRRGMMGAAGAVEVDEGDPASGYLVRYKAINDDVTESGGAVSQWDNTGSSSGWDATQSTASYKPVYSSSSSNMNGKGSITFDGSNDYLDSGETNGTGIITTSAFTIYLALYPTDGSGHFGHSTHTIIGAPGNYYGFYGGVCAQVYGAGYETVGVTVSNNTKVCVEWRFGSGTQTFTVAAVGGEVGSDTDTSAVIGSLTYGSEHICFGGGGTSGVGGQYTGEIGELIFYNTELSSGDRTTTREYLTARYDVSWA